MKKSVHAHSWNEHQPHTSIHAYTSIHSHTHKHIHTLAFFKKIKTKQHSIVESCLLMFVVLFWQFKWYDLRQIIKFFRPQFQFSSVESLSRVQLFATPWTAACQASLSITSSWSIPKLMSIESVMPSNHLIICCPPSPPAFNHSHHQGLFKWVSSLHQVAKLLEFEVQHQSFQWTPRTDLL